MLLIIYSYDFHFTENDLLPKDGSHDITVDLSEILLKDNCEEEYSTGNFSCLRGYFKLDRILGYYFFHGFIPSTLCVVVSWLSFWIQLNCAPG